MALAIVTLLFNDNGKCNHEYEDYKQCKFASLAKLVHMDMSPVNLHSCMKFLIPGYAH